MFRALLSATAAIHLLSFAPPAAADVDIDRLVREAGLETGAVAMRDRDEWRAPRKVLFRGASWIDLDVEGLLPGVEVVQVDSVDDVRRHGADADALIGTCDPAFVDAAPTLRWIQIFSAGAEHCVNVDRIASGDIVLTNMQKMSSPVIGEHAVAMAMALARGLVQYGKSMPSGEWDRSTGSFQMKTLGGSTMLVVGLGGIGTEAARRGAALGMRVVATRNSSREGPDFVDYVGLSDELHELAADADVIVNALPLTPSTTDLIDKAFFDAAKRGHIFINVGRGQTVVTADLVAALEDGRVGAAGLDVTEPEPLPADHPLWRMESVIITPHIAGRAGETERHATLLKENLARFVAGDALYNVVDPARGY